jgi:hypothetical protein
VPLPCLGSSKSGSQCVTRAAVRVTNGATLRAALAAIPVGNLAALVMCGNTNSNLFSRGDLNWMDGSCCGTSCSNSNRLKGGGGSKYFPYAFIGRKKIASDSSPDVSTERVQPSYTRLCVW